MRVSVQTIKLGDLDVSRLILGGNPISGISHQSVEIDSRMRHYFTTAQIKQLFKEAESLGVTTVIARADNHIIRLLMEYWDEGGGIQWIAQTCPELGTIERSIKSAVNGGAKAVYIHGGAMDHLFARGELDDVPVGIEMIRKAGLAAGIAGHNPEVFKWAERELDVDFYMCCYYNPSSRDQSPEHRSDSREWFFDKDRRIMVDLIANLSRPAIHYKIMAAGRNDPADAFAFVREHLRPTDAVCIGVYDEGNPGMLRRDIELIEGTA